MMLVLFVGAGRRENLDRRDAERAEGNKKVRENGKTRTAEGNKDYLKEIGEIN